MEIQSLSTNTYADRKLGEVSSSTGLSIGMGVSG